MKKLLVILFAAAGLSAQEAHDDLMAIQDNSFLLEEAYNQGPGVVQHIGVFTRQRDSGDWELAFTQEFSFLNSMKHQLSYSVPVNNDGLGDIELNYRYQLLGDADANLAITPRLTLVVPTGDDSETAIDAGIALSRIFAPRIAGHTNAGITYVTDDGGSHELYVGQSFVYAPSPKYQLLVEATYAHPEEGDDEIIVSPGIRWVYNRPSGWQIVPGVGLPIGLGDNRDEAVLLYLSFEK
ncbi:MAG TPA: hypothetical protein VEK57_29140 [Thermoanaerobaculia bacterium]|nr:hypothetical protein [Thermoanaerobaculia bacterium]